MLIESLGRARSLSSSAFAVCMCLLLLLCAGPIAFAQSEDTILSLPEGHVILAISATERREVQEDLLTATLVVSARHNDSRAVQNEINLAMQRALAETGKVSDVLTSTGSYQVFETVEPRTKEKKWQGRQTLVLKSKESQKLLDLVGTIQGLGFTVSELNYTLDPATAVALQDDMLEAALMQLQKRAARAAKALGKTTSELKDVNVQDNEQPYPVPRAAGYLMKMEAASSDMAAPVAQADKTTVSLTVSARAILKP